MPLDDLDSFLSSSGIYGSPQTEPEDELDKYLRSIGVYGGQQEPKKPKDTLDSFLMDSGVYGKPDDSLRVETPDEATKKRMAFVEQGVPFQPPSLGSVAMKPLASIGANIERSYADAAQAMDFYSDQLSKLTGLPKTNVFSKLSQDWGYWGDKLSKAGVQGVAGELLRGLGGGIGAVSQIGAMGGGLPGMALHGAFMGGQEGIKGAAVGAAQGALAGGTLHGISQLPQMAQLPVAFGTFAATTPGTLEEKAKAGTQMALLQTMGAKQGGQAELELPKLAKEKLSGLYQRLVSKGSPVEKLGKIRPMEPGDNPALQYAANRKVSALVDATMRYGPVQKNADGTFTQLGEGFDPIIKDYRNNSPIKKVGEQDADLNAYRKSIRIIEDLQRPASGAKEDIATPQQVAEAQKTLASLQQKYGPTLGVLEKTSKRMTDFSRNVLKSGVGTLITPESFDRIVSQNPHYAPFDRILKEVEDHLGPSLPTATTTIKTIRGVSDELAGTIEATYKHAERYIKAVENNRVKSAIYEMAQDVPDQIMPTAPKMRPIKLTAEEAGEAKTVFRPSERPPTDTSVPLFVKGEKKWMEVSKPIYDAIQSATPESANLVHKIMATGASWLRRGATTTLEFMSRNLFRDQLTAGLQTRHGFTPFLSIPSSIASILKQDATYQDFLRSGAVKSGFVGKNRAEIETAYRKIGKSSQLVKRLHIFKDLEDLSAFMEKVSRMGVYKAAVKAGAKPMQAGYEAAEGTVDFSRIGRDTQSLNQTIAFLNAGIQGTDRFLRAYKENPVGMTIKGIVTITVPSIIDYYVNKDDQDYQDLPNWDKYGFWHFAKVGHTFLRVPKPFLPGIVFGTVPQQLIERIHHDNPRAFDGLLGSLVNATSPVGEDIIPGLIPTGMKPLIENYTNWNFFRERPLIPVGKQNLPPEEQYATYTSETAKKVGQLTGTAPVKVENLVQGLFGGAGKYALDIGDVALKATGVVKSQPGKTQKPKELTDIPGIRGWVSSPVYYMQSQELNRFYDNRKKIDSWKGAFGAAAKSGNSDKAKAIRSEHPEIRLAPVFDKFSDSIAAYRKQIERISSAKNMEDEAKRKEMEALARKIIAEAKARNKMFDQLMNGIT